MKRIKSLQRKFTNYLFIYAQRSAEDYSDSNDAQNKEKKVLIAMSWLYLIHGTGTDPGFTGKVFLPCRSELSILCGT